MSTNIPDAAPATTSVAGPRDIGVAALLVASVCIAYAHAFSAAFQFDDYAVIVDNPAVQDLDAWWRSMPGIRPLLKLSYALNHVFAPTSAGFHAVNIGLHALNVLLLWRLTLHWLRRLAPITPTPAFIATIVALLFALHPAATEAVTYTSGRSISLAASFMLGAWLADARAARRGTRISILSPLLFALALGVRETSIVVPFAILLLAACAPHADWRLERARLRGHALVIALGAAAALMLPAYRRFFEVSLATRNPFDQISGQLLAHQHLLVESLLGLATNIDPPLHLQNTSMTALTITATLIAAALIIVWHCRRRWPWLAFGVCWYFLQLAPGNSLMPRLDLANDRHLYLATAGPALIVAMALTKMRSRWPAFITASLLATVLANATLRRNEDYRDELSLWRSSLERAPLNARGWTNYGYAAKLAGAHAVARIAYRCALAIDPTYEQAALNIDALPAIADGAIDPVSDCRVPPPADDGRH